MALLLKFLPLMLIIALVCIIIYTVRDARSSRRSAFAPVVFGRARVCGKRSSINESAGQPDDILSMTSYFVDFQIESGERIELRVPVTIYEKISETDDGILKYQGERYIEFEAFKTIQPPDNDIRKIS